MDRSRTVGSDFLQLDVSQARGGLADWLTERLRDAVRDGRLPVGTRLPASRILAADLGVSRGVVTEAYRRLIEDGHAAGQGRRGTVIVAGGVGPAEPATTEPAAASAPGLRFDREPGSDVFDALRAAPARIDLTPGLPDLGAFPRSAWLRAERAVLGDLAVSGLGYGDPRGVPELRRAVAGWLDRNRGIRADPADVIVLAGTAQALGLLARVLRDRGVDEIAVEDPGSLGTRQHLAYWGMRTPPVPVDGDGVRVGALRDSGAPAVLLTPAHQFPTGAVLSGERRRELARWARDGGGLVVEDDYDAEHRYDRPPVPALRSVLPEHVCYAGSVSKLLAPALRIGWMVAPPAYRDALVDAKRYADLGNATLPQLVLARLMESGEMERRLRLLRRRHRRRRDAMIDAIRACVPGAVVHGAAAGLHLTMTYPGGTPDVEVAAAALERGVKVHPLSWHSQEQKAQGLVLGYAACPVTAIAEAMAVLGGLLRRRR